MGWTQIRTQTNSLILWTSGCSALSFGVMVKKCKGERIAKFMRNMERKEQKFSKKDLTRKLDGLLKICQMSELSATVLRALQEAPFLTSLTWRTLSYSSRPSTESMCTSSLKVFTNVLVRLALFFMLTQSSTLGERWLQCEGVDTISYTKQVKRNENLYLRMRKTCIGKEPWQMLPNC